MSEPINDGGPAFEQHPDSGIRTGMTLRAYIATSLLPTTTMLIQACPKDQITPVQKGAMAAATMATIFADALIMVLDEKLRV